MFSNIRKKLSSYQTELKILIIASLVGCIFSLLTSIINLILDLGLIMIITPLISGLISLFIFYMAAVKKLYKLPAYMSLLMLILFIYPILWFNNSGSRGPISFYMIFNAVFCSVVLTNLNNKIIIIPQLFVFYTLIISEVLFPDRIINYTSQSAKVIDISFSFTLVFLLTFYYINRIMRMYKKTILELDNTRMQLIETNSKLKIASETDELTGIFNRRSVFENLNKLVYLNSPFSVIMIDIDHFKTVNDSYGHNVGDNVLRKICETLNNLTRSTDITGRIGGEEFLIILPGANLNQSYIKAEEIREYIENIAWDEFSHNITISAGVSEYLPHEARDNLLERVDKLLYKSKESGRNIVQS